MAFLIDGKQLVENEIDALKRDIQEITEYLRRPPRFGIFLVGPTESSLKFTDVKIQMADRVGITAERIEFPDTLSTDELKKKIGNETKKEQRRFDGYIFQWPPPRHIGPPVLNALPDEVDVDRMGLYAGNRFLNGREEMLPPLVGAFRHILDQVPIREILPSLKGIQAVVVGAGGGGWLSEYKEWGRVGGYPVFWWLSQQGAAVVPCHRYWQKERIAEEISKADLVFSAVGRTDFIIEAGWLKKGVVVIDGAFFYDDTTQKKRGDMIDHEGIKERAAAYAPSPGGIGRLTVLYVLKNFVELVAKQRGIRLAKRAR